MKYDQLSLTDTFGLPVAANHTQISTVLRRHVTELGDSWVWCGKYLTCLMHEKYSSGHVYSLSRCTDDLRGLLFDCYYLDSDTAIMNFLRYLSDQVRGELPINPVIIFKLGKNLVGPCESANALVRPDAQSDATAIGSVS